MLDRFTSRKLLVTLVTNIVTLFLAFGGSLTDAQAAAIIASVNSLYMVVNYATAKTKAGLPTEVVPAEEEDTESVG